MEFSSTLIRNLSTKERFQYGLPITDDDLVEIREEEYERGCLAGWEEGAKYEGDKLRENIEKALDLILANFDTGKVWASGYSSTKLVLKKTPDALSRIVTLLENSL